MTGACDKHAPVARADCPLCETNGFRYEYKPDAPFASEGQPLFFRRRYGGNPEEPYEQGGTVFVSMEPSRPIWIYGYSIRLTGEDWASCRDVWQRRRAFYAICASVMEPRGEPGFVPADDVMEISREDFERAAAAGWPVL